MLEKATVFLGTRACALHGAGMKMSMQALSDQHTRVQGWKSGTNGTQLWDMLQNSFAWVPTAGYTNKQNITTQFPVVVGEFGSSFASIAVITLLSSSAVKTEPSSSAIPLLAPHCLVRLLNCCKNPYHRSLQCSTETSVAEMSEHSCRTRPS